MTCLALLAAILFAAVVLKITRPRKARDAWIATGEAQPVDIEPEYYGKPFDEWMMRKQ